MLARLQQCIVLTIAIAASAWAWVFVETGRPVVATIGVLIAALGHSAVLAVEFLVMARANRGDAAPRARIGQILRAWISEAVIAPQVFCWRQPFRSRAVPDYTHAVGCRGVVFVHGFVCNRGLWNPWLRRLRVRGTPFVAVNLEPVFGSIDGYVPIIDSAVREMTAATGLPPVLVAHSMGGLAVRAWLAAVQGDVQGEPPVRHVITIGTPHRGTVLGAFAHSPNTRQMRLGSEWIRQLAARERPELGSRFTCFFGHCDNIVFPASTATLPGANNRHIAGCAHVQMALHEEVFGEMEKWLADPADMPAGRAAPSAAQSPARASVR